MRPKEEDVMPTNASIVARTQSPSSQAYQILHLAFVVAPTIAGADKPEHIETNAKALEVKFTPEDLAEIDRITLVDEDRTIAPIYRVARFN